MSLNSQNVVQKRFDNIIKSLEDKRLVSHCKIKISKIISFANFFFSFNKLILFHEISAENFTKLMTNFIKINLSFLEFYIRKIFFFIFKQLSLKYELNNTYSIVGLFLTMAFVLY